MVNDVAPAASKLLEQIKRLSTQTNKKENAENRWVPFWISTCKKQQADFRRKGGKRKSACLKRRTI